MFENMGNIRWKGEVCEGQKSFKSAISNSELLFKNTDTNNFYRYIPIKKFKLFQIPFGLFHIIINIILLYIIRIFNWISRYFYVIIIESKTP